MGILAFDLEEILLLRLGAQDIQLLSRRERESQQLTGTVDELTCGYIRGPANFRALHILSLRLYQQQLRGAAGEMPGQVRLLHLFQPVRTPQSRCYMALLMGYLYKRYLQSLRQQCRMRNAHKKAGHIASLHGPGPSADAYRGDLHPFNMGK